MPGRTRAACRGELAVDAGLRRAATQVGVTNQLETDTVTVTSFELLCVPSEKHGFQPAS